MVNGDTVTKGVGLSSPACSLPWTTLLVYTTGHIGFCCCGCPAFAHINNLSENAIDEIWNGKTAQNIRRKWVEGTVKGGTCGDCVGLQRFNRYDHIAEDIVHSSNAYYKDDNVVFDNARLNVDEFHQGKTILQSMPTEIVYVPSELCNMRCTYCFQVPQRENNVKIESLLKMFRLLGGKALRNVFSGGEPLRLPQVFQMIDGFSLEYKASTEALFQTNGTLIKDTFHKIGGFRKYGFRISISGFRKDTYEHVHKGVDFERLLENLKFLVERKSEGMDISMTLVMILMRSNFSDLENIFDFAGRYQFDDVWVTPVHEVVQRGKILHEENIFRLPYLLEKIPSWAGILEEASHKSREKGYKSAHYNLEYIKSRLSTSVEENRYSSIQNIRKWARTKRQLAQKV